MAASPAQQAAGGSHEGGHQAYIALGSNLGDPAVQLRAAVTRLSELWPVVARSSLYATDPVGGPQDQGEYLNAVVAIATQGTAPHLLLERLLGIEREMGRTRSERWGPRLIDLDLLAVGDAVVGAGPCDADAQRTEPRGPDTELRLPHPRLAERAFVLVPLCEIGSRRNEKVRPWLHPVTGLDACTMLAGLAAESRPPGSRPGLGVRVTDLRW